MHNMRIALDLHKLGYLNCAWLADSPDIITPQVNEHDMLSALLLVVSELFFQSRILGGVLAAAAGAGDGMGGYRAIFNSYQKLGGGSRDIEITQVKVVHVGRRVNGAQSPIYGKGTSIGTPRPALGQNSLNYIAGKDVLLGLGHYALERCLREV